MRLMARLLALEEKLKPGTDWEEVCRDYARILQAWENNESWESVSTDVSSSTMAMLGVDAETWDRQRQEARAVYEKTFGV